MSQHVTIHFYKNEGRNPKLKSEYTCTAGETLLSVLQKLGFVPDAVCGGKGICGACAIQFVKEAPIPSPAERSFFSAEQLRDGMRLACRIQVTKDLHLAEPFYRKQPDILFGKLDMVKMQEVDEGEVIIAVDLGTTTIAMELRSLANGQVLGQYAALNPQRKFGADVISRMEKALQSDADAKELKNLVTEEIEKGITYFKVLCPKLVNGNTFIYLAGNTVMEHLLMGYEVKGLSKYPFTPVTLNFDKMTIAGLQVILLPGISAFVGADILADLYALDMIPGILPEISEVVDKEARKSENRQHRKKLLADLGTNAELACLDGDKLTVTATAAGPAFEGGITAGIFGADLINLTSELLRKKKLEETGLLQGEAFEKGIEVQGILIKNEDIRKLQLAKAAVAAGIRMFEADEQTQIYLAGGFGYYLNAESAIRIGLLPGVLAENIECCGNLVLTGIYKLAKDLLLGQIEEKQLRHALDQVRVVNLAEMEDFEERYLAEINFPT